MKKKMPDNRSQERGGTSPGHEVVLSSRVRLARNLKELPFPSLATDQQTEEVFQRVRKVIDGQRDYFKGYRLVDLSVLSRLERQLLVEKHIISPQLVKDLRNSHLLLKKDETVSVMINEEDHLRVQCLLPGLQLGKAWEQADGIDDVLEEGLDLAFDDGLGYLTSCPTNLGTGLRASLMMHLPGLVITNQINRILSALYQVGLVVRGLYGEGTEVAGNMFQVSNQLTLGHSEKEIMQNLHGVVRQLLDQEENARQALLNDTREKIDDRVNRALGILSNARLISRKEAMELLSDLRLGVDLRLVEGVDREVLDRLLLVISTPYLQKEAGEKEMGSPEIDLLRASLVREMLKAG